MKNKFKMLLVALMFVAMTACGGSSNDTINVISREAGSGTRTAFIELFGIEIADADGTKVDHTTDKAEVTNNTSVMMTTVANNKNAVGYLSLGSLNDTVKSVRIDGVDGTVDNVRNGSYPIVRPFNLVVKEDSLSEVSQDFIRFILSTEGQAVVEEEGYIALEDSVAYQGTLPSGKIVVGGSSSVSPLMEKLQEAYLAINPNAQMELQTQDSTTGVNNAIDGIYDIGMASRDVKDTEIAKGVSPIVIAQDAIVVIVSNDNAVEDLTSEQVKNIFMGETLNWKDIEQ